MATEPKYDTIDDVSLEQALEKDGGLEGNLYTRRLKSSALRGEQHVTGSMVTTDEDNDKRIISGKLPDETFGLVISKDGINVYDAFS